MIVLKESTVLIVTLVLLVGSYGDQSRFQNTTDTIERLLKGYDIRLRPQFEVQALRIGMEIIIASFDSISEVNMDYTITMYLNQYWTDERLVYSNDSDDNLTLTGDFAEKIWVPDTFFANDKNSFLHDITEKKQNDQTFWKRFDRLWNEIHHDSSLHDGPPLLSTGRTKLHGGGRKLWLHYV